MSKKGDSRCLANIVENAFLNEEAVTKNVKPDLQKLSNPIHENDKV